jgi:hypothetical protein
MSSNKKRQLVEPGPDSTNKIRQSPTSVTETSSPISPDWNRMKTIENIPGAAQGKPPGPPLSLINPDTLPKTLEEQEKELRKKQDKKNQMELAENTEKNIALALETGKPIKPQETFDEINERYAKSDKKDFKELDENKDWGLTFGGKKSKRKTRKTKRKSKRKTRKSKKTKRKTRKSKKSKRKGRKTRRK